MATEDLTGSDKFVDDLVAANPVATDSVSDGDEHIRGVKNVLKNTLPNVTAAVTATAAQLNKTASTFTGADGSSAGASGMVTAPVATDNTKFLKGDGTWATPSGSGGGGSGGTITAVASGAIANGDKVILKSDGKVATVSEAVTGVDTPTTIGSEVTFESYALWGTAVTYNPNLADQVVVAYMDRSNSNYGTVRLGTITGTTPAFESEVVFHQARTNWIQIAFDPNTTGKFVVAYEAEGDLNKLKAVVGTITNTTVTFGSEYTLDSTGAISWTSCEFDPNTAGKFLVAYSDEGSLSYGRVLVSTINYTTGVITPGSPYTFKSSSTTYIDAAFDPNTAGKFVVGYAASSNGYTIVGTITTGTTVTFGSEVSFYSTAAPWDVGVDFDPDTAGRFMVIYRASGINLTVYIGTVTGTVPSYGSANNVWVGTAWGVVAKFIKSNEIIFGYLDSGSSPTGQFSVNLGTVSGTTVTMGTAQVVNAASTTYLDIATDPNTVGRFITSYVDGGDSSYGKTAVGQLTTSTLPTNLTADNFIGISDAAYADAATATIQVIGSTDDAQSGMTTGSNYYVQTDGTLATTAGSTSAFVGVALSATEILIGGATTLADLTDSTTATTDPLVTSNQAVGHFWINSTSGEAYVCTDATTNENVWTNIGSGSGDITFGYDIDYLVIAGGAGGGYPNQSGGGGAGGYRCSYGSETSGGGSSSETSVVAAPGDVYTITVGAGGAYDVNGSDSIFASVTSTGGGTGGYYTTPAGSSGGSGGGSGAGFSSTRTYGGNGTAAQGYSGGDAFGYSGDHRAGGGGGAGSIGGEPGTSGGDGGSGLTSSITGTPIMRAGGGAGGAYSVSGGSATGGGGTGGSNNAPGGSGSANSGGGAGGGTGLSSGSGGSGVVILRVPTLKYSGTTSGSPTVTTDGAYKVLKYTGNGTYTG